MGTFKNSFIKVTVLSPSEAKQILMMPDDLVEARELYMDEYARAITEDDTIITKTHVDFIDIVADYDIGLSVLEEIAQIPDKKIQKEVYDLIVKKEITREQIKNFKDLKGWDESKMTEVPQMKVSPGKIRKKIFHDVSVSKGKGCLLFDTLSSHQFLIDNFEIGRIYKITIEEI